MILRRGFLKRLLALVALPLLPATAVAATPPRVVGGWVLTDRDLTEIARLDR
jgi:hypothetical protein